MKSGFARSGVRWQSFLFLALFIAGSLGTSLAMAEKDLEVGKQKRYKNLELFQKVLHFIEKNYVDQVDHEQLIHGAIKGMMERLDPHSNFLPPEIYRDMRIDTSGKFGGLGIEIGIRDNVLTVITPIEDTPAWNAGIEPGDRIVKIDNTSTKGMTLSEAVAKMRGERGKAVIITVFRSGFKKAKDYKVVRAEIKIKSVKVAELESGYGYVKLNNFSENAAQEISGAIKKFEKGGITLKGLVLDLRNNPGGLLDQAVDVSSLFVERGVVVSTVGRNRDQREVKHVRRGKARKDFPMVVLVSSSTASAAEIVAGALQDHNRAVIMGQPTFGKGSVQTVIELGGEMGLKLTIARFHTPSGRSIQEQGVEPDIILDQYDPSLLAKAKIKSDLLRERDLPGHITGKDYSSEELEILVGDRAAPEPANVSDGSDKKNKSSDPKKDFQVSEALNYLKSYYIFNRLKARQLSSAGGASEDQPKTE